MKGIIGRKLGMTQVFNNAGQLVPVTVIEAGPCSVLALRTREKDGYSAVQLGFGTRKVKNVSKPVLGHLKGAGRDSNPPACIREVRTAEDTAVAVGDEVKASVFSENDFVDITARTKGRGFQGVVKRHHFGGGRVTHGGGWVRRTGSIGMCVNPGRVYKGRKMPGRMGGVQRTVQNLRVVDVRPDENLLLIKGAVPGPNGGIVMVRGACKK
jgi:large subunit ribosomal protein L3